ncbi:very long-chain acyl-CoA synthetase-like isoform X2 [Chanos chanos]|uniref:long-chain-fatty-acid--CoA ligase n=1 Tax=Chanos chanos TaxID=29144 RepID=A0A6J2X067_CHACN|nr:very long-chain acyl-CoA synthetase-like isoform X2 [Chanos chanos]
MFWLSMILGCLVITPLVLNVFLPYFWHDVLYFKDLMLILCKFASRRRRKPLFLVVDRFLEQALKHPDKPFIVFENKTYSYKDADRESNKIANALQWHSYLKQGATAALYMGNEPAFIFTWLALAKLGCAVALLNKNVRSRSLLHCFNCSGANVLIASSELKGAVEEIQNSLKEGGVSVFIMSRDCHTLGMHSLADKVEEASDAPIPQSARSSITFNSPAVYIYTSGTTGSTIILRRKFSASRFWDECREYNVTVIQYIGEVLRYLCNTPKRDNDKEHKVRLAIGNGVRAEVWREFLNRFGQIKVREFYASTESNIGFVNYTGKIGAVGRVNFLHRKLFPYTLIKYDTERDEPVRDSKGLCIEVPKGETGLLVSRITDIAPFTGYARNQQHTEKKKLRDVFQKGDLYFNSGDLLMIDHDNFIYFQDRVGDTFRWKGENVATTEVSDVLTLSDFVKEANVYGVKVPGHEGRIGMAAVTIREGEQFDGTKMFSHVTRYLPLYALPRFIRIQDSVEVTATFKQMKMKLVEAGFNPALIPDPLFFLDEKEKSYIPMTREIYSSITSGHIKL